MGAYTYHKLTKKLKKIGIKDPYQLVCDLDLQLMVWS